MNINRVTVHGFKSYDDTVVFGPFANGKNALVGLNGTGKSNFYSAIGFVLLDEYAHIRVADRKNLLHEGQGQNAMTAYVEIVFDNKSRNMPFDKDEVSIRRSIGLKKDEYFIDRKNSTRQDVHNLLESSNFSPSNGYYIVRQGQVSALTLMKDSDRLDLIYDIAGTKFYDQQREESMKMINESNARTEKIKDSLEYIQNRLSQLDDEKKELEELEELDRSRRAAEYHIQRLELARISDDLQNQEESRQQEAAAVASLNEDYSQKHQELKDLHEHLHELKAQEDQYTKQRDKAERIKHESIEAQTRAEYKTNEISRKLQDAEKIKESLREKLAKIEQAIEEKTQELNTINEELPNVSAERASVEGQLEALTQIVGGKIQETSSTESQLRSAKATLKRLREQEEADRKVIAEAEERLSKLEHRKVELDEQLNGQYSNQTGQKEHLNELMNEKKELWRDEDKFGRETKKLTRELEDLKSKINHAMPTEIATGLSSVKNLNYDGVCGAVYNLIDCPDDLSYAVSVVGKGKLFNVVVENDKVSDKLVRKLTDEQLGVVTFIPLNTIKKSNFKPPEGLTTLVSQLKFDKKYTHAINYVFGKTILVDTIDEAAQLSTKYSLNVVTRDGDFVTAHGPISGGSRSHHKSPMTYSARIAKKEKRLEEIKSNLGETKERLEKVETEIREINDFLNSSKNERKKLKSERVTVSMKITDIKEEIESKNRQLDRLADSIESAERDSISIEKRLKYIQNFNSQVDENTLQQLKDCRHHYDDLSRRHITLSSQKIEVSSDLSNKLQPRRKRILDDLDKMEVDKLQQQLEVAQRDGEIAKKNYEESTALLSDLEEKLTQATKDITTTEDEATRLQRSKDRVSTQLNNAKNNIERILTAISLLQQRHEECLKQQKDIGALPETEIQNFEGFSKSELLRQLSNINQECQRYRHVNKKAIEQHRSFTQQQQELTARQEELRSSRESISNLIETLDKRKEVAIARTFAQISENFTQILSELDPNAHGQLVLQKDEEKNEYIGVTIKAQFEDQEVVSLSQLSGGQKTLIALTLVFAIQKYAPAPFYLFDEVDSALDDKYRLAVSRLMDKFCNPEKSEDAAQIIFTTFKNELLEGCDKYFAVKYDRGHSTCLEINSEEAHSIVTEQLDNK
ncbi:Structural maintenance of chromosomes protein 3 [Tritrichomonas foetus]|uniref:Structural maintenance of chromosomes protein 3 n=1 Tax=Tritrichomonas foetus TaxID=1144522 RepID=A0A1J4KHA6_9EUKA|nr:Structural maintenance of chromosomes protein 3 [Tritrichomonas foetus]|eukprot:OHT10571.1 Structural maintenance of chromosomes protein 3 [Tritrichomonas foetus]